MRISDWSSDVCSSDLGEGAYFADNHVRRVAGRFQALHLEIAAVLTCLEIKILNATCIGNVIAAHNLPFNAVVADKDINQSGDFITPIGKVQPANRSFCLYLSPLDCKPTPIITLVWLSFFLQCSSFIFVPCIALSYARSYSPS